LKRADYDVVVVGAGIFGLTVAHQFATKQNKRVLVLDKRNHVGGNAYSYFEPETGIEVHKYGAHIFHTSDRTVWEYVNQFSAFTNYQHRVWTTHQGQVYPMPINLATINQFFNANYTPDEARNLINSQALEFRNAQHIQNGNSPEIQHRNLVEQGVSLIGQPLFDAFIKNYTAKQWQTPAEELAASIITRLPVRFNYNNRYFNDIYEGLPEAGYEQLFQNIINHANRNSSNLGRVDVQLETDFFAWRELTGFDLSTTPLVFTGPIDTYFDYSCGQLQWRSLQLDLKIADCYDFQGCPVMNYADLDAEQTRVHEFKHFHTERVDNPKYAGYASNYKRTAVVYEYPKNWKVGDEPYYPVATQTDLDVLNQYQQLAEQQPNLYFGGRLGEYKYYDMDKVFASALKFASTTKL
jgi:UDP-galactopyranose mutase